MTRPESRTYPGGHEPVLLAVVALCLLSLGMYRALCTWLPELLAALAELPECFTASLPNL